jgi:hypothetical protein
MPTRSVRPEKSRLVKNAEQIMAHYSCVEASSDKLRHRHAFRLKFFHASQPPSNNPVGFAMLS